MNNLKPLILGDGLLGKELISQTNWDMLSRKTSNFNINNIDKSIKNINNYNIIINCIANTDTYSNNKDEHWDTNYVFVNNLIDYCNKHRIKLVHISSDYIYSNSKTNASENDIPIHCNNWYSYTKLLGDSLVQLRSNNYIVCRCTHKPYPFPYLQAWHNQTGNFDYVNVIAKLIIEVINKEYVGVINIGTDHKSIYKLALQTNKNVTPTLKPDYVPSDTSMDCSKMKELLNKK